MIEINLKRRTLYLIVLLLIACVSAVYWDVDKFEFISFDDSQYVSNNYHIFSGFNKKNMLWAFTSFYAANWHPLTWLSHMLDCQLYRLKPAGHHLTNVMFHLLNTLLLFFVLKGMTGAVWRSALVAALFGLHPLHVESVAWVSERKDVLSAFFMLLSVLFYSSFVIRQKRSYYEGALVTFALGLMAKPMIVTLPFVLLLLDFWPFRRFALTGTVSLNGDVSQKRFISLCIEKIPFLVLTAASCIVTALAQHAGKAIGKTDKFSFVAGFANAMISYVNYMGKMFWPVKLSFFYPFPATLPSIWNLLFSFIILFIITFFAIILVKKKPYFLMGWLWFLGTMVPVIGIVRVGSQAMADRYTYIPLIGLFIIFVWALYEVAARSRMFKSVTIGALLVVLCLLAYQARKQTQYWKDDLTLGNHGLSVSKENFFAYNLEGNYLLSQNNYREAFRCFATSLFLCPEQEVPLSNIGLIFLKQGKPKEAIAVYKKLLIKDPDNIMANLNCGNAYGLLGDTRSAIACFTRIITIDSTYALAIHNIGEAFEAQRDYQKCRSYLLMALQRDPNNAETYYALGNCCFYDNDMLAAVQWYKKSISLYYDFADSHRQLGKAYSSSSRHDLAQREFAIADSLTSLDTAKKR
ncbi:MAG TPA: tetratricopeptide repeat protein [Chitinivibrionales bacterium]|nr:tetratricopeptide repeat protein [Chitinivibrionales bacterium]